jgi:phytoene dehydrogenase-like protein
MSDVLVVGAGHNDLICAFYLAAHGLKVKIVKKRAVVGGAAVTEDLHRNSETPLALQGEPAQSEGDRP